MERVWVASHNIISPLGKTSEENFKQIQSGERGVSEIVIGGNSLYAGAILNRDDFKISPDFGIFESLLIQSIKSALQNCDINPEDAQTIFIISSTKGEIDNLDDSDESVNLFQSSHKVAKYFKNPNTPLVVSNACISGSLAILMAKRLINNGMFENAVVSGCDIISEFVTSGFNSLQAISSEPCKPFDGDRKGINMGEAAATLIITRDQGNSSVSINGGATSNDANHISGPSRTGEELAIAIRKAMDDASLENKDIDFINAHGTATLFNDEMEANAFNHAGLSGVPLNSLKGYYGHTLGAAGCVECALSIESLMNDELVKSIGFEKKGTTKSVNVIVEPEKKELRVFLKTASGFGGCNAVLAFEKVK